MAERHFICYDCKSEWALPHGTGRPGVCPKCNSANIHRAPQDRELARIGRGFRSGRGSGDEKCTNHLCRKKVKKTRLIDFANLRIKED